ncbi:MAG: type VI secretion system secreted protein Hcp [Candidatus Krumholzibacteriia bacterium]|jgi:type VI secretion system secreted protein Hcp
MAFDAFMYFPKTDIEGETQDTVMIEQKALEIINFEIGAENTINIGSISGGGGAGKATFKQLSITKKTDTSSAQLFAKLCEGKHFNDMIIELRRSGGSAGKSGEGFLKWEFKLVMLADISWSGSDGDDICEETILIDYGAMKVSYRKQGQDGKMEQPKTAEWSRVKNQANFAV